MLSHKHVKISALRGWSTNAGVFVGASPACIPGTPARRRKRESGKEREREREGGDGERKTKRDKKEVAWE